MTAGFGTPADVNAVQALVDHTFDSHELLDVDTDECACTHHGCAARALALDVHNRLGRSPSAAKTSAQAQDGHPAGSATVPSTQHVLELRAAAVAAVSWILDHDAEPAVAAHQLAKAVAAFDTHLDTIEDR